MNHVVVRTITALTTASLVVVGLLYLPVNVISVALIVLVALAHLEFSQMVAKKYETMTWVGVALGVCTMLSPHIPIKVTVEAGFSFELLLTYVPVLFVALFVLMWFMALFGKYKTPLVAAGTTLLGVVYIPMMLLPFSMLPSKYGMHMFLYVVAIIKISDMGGFAFGLGSKKIFGNNHKMCPTISPNKSWEGMFGSIFASCLISCCFMPITHFGFGKSLALGMTAAIVGTLGDLVESRFKRECDVKDSATFMPAGLGGFLDMFDSLVFAPAVLYPFLGK
jgi:phosphatidate cytidylyltransferase